MLNIPSFKLVFNIPRNAFQKIYDIKLKSQEDPLFSSMVTFFNLLNVRFLYLTKRASHALAGETAAEFTPILYMLGFGLLAAIPALVLSRLISPRRRYNPVKFLPMECGQMPTGEGRSHFMMQYYAYILMFVVFDVMSIFLYAWATALFSVPRAATLPIIGFLAIMFAAMGYALYLSGRKGIW
jgi:NADH:ubiquinone oxidoreductase subunit 3 (subunit A)